jgi:SAM-dependent methyltransferase
MESAPAGHPHQPGDQHQPGGPAHGHGHGGDGDGGHGGGTGHGGGHGHGGGDAAEWAAWAELLDLDGEVFHAYLSGLTAWVCELAGDRPGGQVIDLGCGTGSGTFALARAFEEAEVIALDASADLLGRLTATASDLGLAGRVHARLADLNGDWPGLDAGSVDVAWASMSLHHLANPDAALARVLAVLRPGGLVAVAETDDPFVRFLPDDIGLGRPGLEERLHAELAEDRTAEMPELSADWGARLERAGFAVMARRPFPLRLTPPLPAATGRFAQLWMERTRSRLAGRLAGDDLAVLDTLISDGPDGVRSRGDLIVAASRTAWVAQRPGA